MHRGRDTSPLIFAITIVMTLAIALLPANWPIPGWQREIASIARFPFVPFTDGVTRIGRWMRPPPVSPLHPAGIENIPTESRAVFDQLVEEANLAQRLYRAEQQRVRELEEQIRQLQQIAGEKRSFVGRTIYAPVISTDPSSTVGLFQVKLPPGAARLVSPNVIAVYEGTHLIGRVVGEPSRSLCTVQPIVHELTGPITARVFEKSRMEQRVADAPLVQVEPTGRGTFSAEASRELVIERGDVVRLDDPRWPATAQMMELGRVESIAVKDEQPLRNRIVIRPVYQAKEIYAVTIIVPEDDVRVGR